MTLHDDIASTTIAAGVWKYDPLPYRRVLSTAESAHIWASLGSVWGVPVRSYWYPLSETSIADIVAFRADDFREFVPAHGLRRKLVKLSIERVWELREHGPEYSEDVELFDPLYNGAEGFWTASGYPWVIYASHESSITVAGALLSEIKRMWPTWQEHRW
jgi:hypothetical protein